MVILDANAILRYILHDNEAQAGEVIILLERTRCLAATEVLAEVIYVLGKVYKTPRAKIVEAVQVFLNEENISSMQSTIIAQAMESYASTNLDFVDCVLSGYQMQGYSIFTFDKKLQSYLNKLS